MSRSNHRCQLRSAPVITSRCLLQGIYSLLSPFFLYKTYIFWSFWKNSLNYYQYLSGICTQYNNVWKWNMANEGWEYALHGKKWQEWWMCNVRLEGRFSCHELIGRLNLNSKNRYVKNRRLSWFDHIGRMSESCWCSTVKVSQSVGTEKAK